jgi:hypothetical protein
MRLPLCVLFLAFAVAPAAGAQGTISTSLSAAANPGSVTLGQSTTVTATLTVASGPISATDGLTVTFQTLGPGASATLSNGVAQFSYTPSCGGATGSCDNTVYATFEPQGNFGPSYASVYITLYQPTPPQFSGAYAFRFSGRSVLAGRDTGVGAVGVMVSDGKGNITGVEDVNTGAGMFSSLAFTGTYSLGVDGTGAMTLTTSLGTQTFALYLPQNAQYTVAAVSGTFIETDALVEGNGVFLRQDQDGITFALANPGSTYAAEYGKGTYVVDGAGSTACMAQDCTLVGHAAGPVLAAGQLTLAVGGAITGQAGESIGAQFGSLVPVTGTASAFDSNGRMPFTVIVPGGPSDQPSNFIAYLIDREHFFYVSADPATRDILLVGTAAQVTP